MDKKPPVSPNQTYGLLTTIEVLPRGEIVKGKHTATEWLCICECGTKKPIAASALRHGLVKSCGCLRNTSRKGMAPAKAKSYAAWAMMKRNCDKKSGPRYNSVGAIGITYPSTWVRFEGFYADIGDAPAGKFFTRKDLKLDFSKDNCEWSDKRPHRGTSKNRENAWQWPFSLDDDGYVVDALGIPLIMEDKAFTQALREKLVEALNVPR